MYRQCLKRLGVDDVTCAAYLKRTVKQTDKQYAMQVEVLGHKARQAVSGLCGMTEEDDPAHEVHLLGGSRIRSQMCQMFCSRVASRDNGSCAQKLQKYCESQTEQGGHEESCSCWLPRDTYTQVLMKQQDSLGLTSDTAMQVNSAITNSSMRPHCWYKRCNASRNTMGPPDSQCPSTTINVCINEIDRSKLTAGRDLNINMECHMGGGDPNKDDPGQTPGPTKGKTNPGGGGGGGGGGGPGEDGGDGADIGEGDLPRPATQPPPRKTYNPESGEDPPPPEDTTGEPSPPEDPAATTTADNNNTVALTVAFIVGLVVVALLV